MARAKTLDSMRRGIETIQGDAHKNAVNYGKVLCDIGKIGMSARQHEDKMDIEWTKVERITGLTRDELLEKLREVEADDVSDGDE